MPVDPGQHTIEAAAPGRAPFTKTVELTRAGASETVAVPIGDRSTKRSR
ncbi:hypothetical protein [Sorangium sp. So ce117]